jgi:hypothetical protein
MKDYKQVIIKMNDEEVATRVKHENYVLNTEVVSPSSYEEAILQQHTDIDALLIAVVVLFGCLS